MLPKTILDKIQSSVDDVYARIKARFLGTEYQKKGIEFKVTNSLEDFYRDIAEREGVIEPSEDNIDTLKRVAGSYLDASKQKATAQVVNAVQSSIRQAVLSGDTKGIGTALEGALTEVWANATTHVHTILDSEINSTKNISIMDGIVQSNSAVGVEDPVVVFVIVRDGNACKECVRLHMMPDGVTPRCWYLSEVGHGYHKKGEDTPKTGGLHPHCRCVMSTVMPGFGFNAAGRVTFIAPGYSEIAKQRGLGKSEMEYKPHDCQHCSEDLAKSTRKTLDEGLWDQIQAHVKERTNFHMWGGQRSEEKHRYPNPELERDVNESPIVIHVPYKALKGLYLDGRFKTQFDTGTSVNFFPEYRKDAEKNLFNIPNELSGDYRPVYGVFNIGHLGTSNQSPTWYAGGPAKAYGPIMFELHPHVKHRSTITVGDSLNLHASKVRVHGDHHDLDPFSPSIDQYVEAQIHGGVDLSKDVKAIHARPLENSREGTTNDISYKQRAHLKAVGKKYGIPVYYHRGDPKAGVHFAPYHSTEVLYDPAQDKLPSE